jgi:hypothetical protein
MVTGIGFPATSTVSVLATRTSWAADAAHRCHGWNRRLFLALSMMRFDRRKHRLCIDGPIDEALFVKVAREGRKRCLIFGNTIREWVTVKQAIDLVDVV